MKRVAMIMLLAAMLLPAVAQEVEVTSLQRLLDGVDGRPSVVLERER